MKSKSILNFFILLVGLIIITSVVVSCSEQTGLIGTPGMETNITTPMSTVDTPIPSATQTSTPTSTPTPIPSLRNQVRKHNFYIGTAVDPGWLYGEQAFADLVSREFNMLTPEVAMKWEVIHPERDYYNFEPGDLVVEFAQQHGMLVRGHPLVWDIQLPGWVLDAYAENRFSRDEWIAILRGHIKTVAGHYRGQIYAWDVVNEAFADDGTLRDTIWLQTIGPEYIEFAFLWAHEADPYALLFYNDNGGEGMNVKSDAIYAFVSELQGKGIPIHGVGLQTHTGLGFPLAEQDIRQNIGRISDLGLRVHITEMDVRTQYSKASEEEKLALQAEMYRAVFKACLETPMCEAFVTWGATDRHSWIPGHTGQPDMPLLFDEQYQPKPAYHAIMELLIGYEQ